MAQRIDGSDASSATMREWLEDMALQLRWQRRNGVWTPEMKEAMRALERLTEDTADKFTGGR